jgi:uncharacterized protein (TIGR02001 family)
MKKLFLAVLFMVGAVGSASAAEVYGSVGLDSNYVFEGLSRSDKDPSVNGTIGVNGPVGLFIEAEAHSVRVPSENRVFVDPTVEFTPRLGIKNHIDGFNYSVFIERYDYTGSDRLLPVSTMNNTRVGATGEYMGVFGKVTQISQSNEKTVFGDISKDTTYTIGYQHEFPVAGKKLNAGIDAIYVNYDIANVSKYTATEVFASYPIWKKVDLVAKASFGGKDVTDAKLDDQYNIGVKYTF